MQCLMSVAISTHVIGWGGEWRTDPTPLMLPQASVSARTLVAEHIHNEINRASQQHTTSLALQYLTHNPYTPSGDPDFTLNASHEMQRAYAALESGECLLMIDGVPVKNLDAALHLTTSSRIGFVRLFSLMRSFANSAS